MNRYPEDWAGKWRCETCGAEQPRHPNTKPEEMPKYHEDGLGVRGRCHGKWIALGGWKTTEPAPVTSP